MRKKEPVIVVMNKPDKVFIEKSNTYKINLTIGLNESGDYYLQLDFNGLNEIEFKKLIELSKLNRRLEFYSDIIKKENYNITHIVITDFSTSNSSTMTWKCLSDDPNLYDFLLN